MKYLNMLFLMFCLLISFSVYAQNAATIDQVGQMNDISLEQLGDLNSVNVEQVSQSDLNRLWLKQIGINNSMVLSQEHSGSMSESNVSAIVQKGTFNHAIINMRGAGNEKSITQNGNNNHIEQTIDATQSTFELVQNGNGNRALQVLQGDELDFVLKQNGNNNEIQQFETEAAAPKIQITQNGSGMRLIINNGSIGR